MQKLLKKNHKKIGILGGTFDPPHKGHLKISKQAKQKYKLNYIIWAISKKGKMELSDLYEAPFDRIGSPSKLFEEDDIEDIMIVCKTLEKRFNAISWVKTKDRFAMGQVLV